MTRDAPKLVGGLDDLGVPAAELLRGLPGVALVEVLVKVDQPTHRIIHLCDIPLEAGQDYRGIELVQLEQAVLLRCLVKLHGLRQVLVEGLTPEGVAHYREVIAALANTSERLNRLVKERASQPQVAPAIDAAITQLVSGHRRRLLEYGAAGRLAMTGEIVVLPLDDDRLVTPAAAVEARHDSQVRAALNSGCTSLLILDGTQDLSYSVRRLESEAVEFLRVTTTRFRKVAPALSCTSVSKARRRCDM